MGVKQYTSFQKIIVLIYLFWWWWVFFVPWAFLWLRRRAAALTAEHSTHCSGFAYCRPQALRCLGFSSCSSCTLEHRLHGCGTQASLLHGMWGSPRPGTKRLSLALAAGGFFTTELGGGLKQHTSKRLHFKEKLIMEMFQPYDDENNNISKFFVFFSDIYNQIL